MPTQCNFIQYHNLKSNKVKIENYKLAIKDTMYKQRLMKQALEAAKRKFTQFLLIFDEQDLLNWQAFIEGPEDTPYQNKIFLVKIVLSHQYPLTPPKMYFKTKIFHPNIHFVSGQVCLDIIKSEWSPSWTLQALCRAIKFLLQNPNQDSPLNCDAANLIRLKEIKAYNSLARMYSNQYAIAKQDYKKASLLAQGQQSTVKQTNQKCRLQQKPYIMQQTSRVERQSVSLNEQSISQMGP